MSGVRLFDFLFCISRLSMFMFFLNVFLGFAFDFLWFFSVFPSACINPQIKHVPKGFVRESVYHHHHHHHHHPGNHFEDGVG